MRRGGRRSMSSTASRHFSPRSLPTRMASCLPIATLRRLRWRQRLLAPVGEVRAVAIPRRFRRSAPRCRGRRRSRHSLRPFLDTRCRKVHSPPNRRILCEGSASSRKRLWRFWFMNRMLVRLLVVMAIVGAAPRLASAQTLAGTVRDTSGAVLPGVTIEASSPALITKIRHRRLRRNRAISDS